MHRTCADGVHGGVLPVPAVRCDAGAKQCGCVPEVVEGSQDAQDMSRGVHGGVVPACTTVTFDNIPSKHMMWWHT